LLKVGRPAATMNRTPVNTGASGGSMGRSQPVARYDHLHIN